MKNFYFIDYIIIIIYYIIILFLEREKTILYKQ